VIRYLLDVNVPVALIDPAHVQHDRAHDRFAAHGRAAWATCPTTENGVLRIVGHPRYRTSPGNPAAVAGAVAGLRSLPGHAFWPDDIPLFDSRLVDTSRLFASGQVTGTYLLAMAAARGGQLATFDRRLVPNAVSGGLQALHVIR
jgi:toxin-antitoxin system PIN domain toxin